MAQADTKNGFLADQLANVVFGIRHRVRVAGSIGQKYAIRLQSQNIFSGSIGRNDFHPATALGEISQNVVLDAEIVSDDGIPRSSKAIGLAGVFFGPWLTVLSLAVSFTQSPQAFVPFVRIGAAHVAHQIATLEPRSCLGF